MNNRLLPGRVGPFVGIAVGAGLGYHFGLDAQASNLMPYYLLGGAGAGLLAGSVVWLSDWWTVRRGLARLEREKFAPRRQAKPSIALPILAWVFALAPFLGLAFSIAAYRASDGASNAAFYSFVPSGTSTLAGSLYLLSVVA